MRRQNQIFKVVGNFLFSSLNKEFPIFLFFLLLSGAFWLMMALNETYEEELKVPVRLVGMPRNAVMTDEPADTVKVTVRDKGFTLVTYKYGHWFPTTYLQVRHLCQRRPRAWCHPGCRHHRSRYSPSSMAPANFCLVKPEKLDLYFTYGASKKSARSDSGARFLRASRTIWLIRSLANDGDGVCQQEGTR